MNNNIKEIMELLGHSGTLVELIERKTTFNEIMEIFLGGTHDTIENLQKTLDQLAGKNLNNPNDTNFGAMQLLNNSYFSSLKANNLGNYQIPISENFSVEISEEDIEEKRKSLASEFNLWFDSKADYIIIILIDILFIYYFFGTKDIQNISKTAIDLIVEVFVIPKINEPFYSKIPDFWNKLKAGYFEKLK